MRTRARVYFGPPAPEQPAELGSHLFVRKLDREDGLAGRLEEHEPDPAAERFLVVGHRLPGRVEVDRGGLGREHALDLLENGRVEAEMADREAQGRTQSERHRAAVGRPFVPARRLDPVGERVTEVQDCPPSTFARVGQHHRRLERSARPHHPDLVEPPDLASREQPRLHDLGHAFRALRRRKRLEQVRVDEDPGRRMERPDEVLPLRQVDRRLSTDRRVHLADERRRHGYPGHAAQICRGDEPRDVGRRAAPERDDSTRSVDAELVPEPRADAERLRALPGRNAMRRDEPVSETRGVEPEHPFVRDESAGSARRERARPGGRPLRARRGCRLRPAEPRRLRP